MKRLFFIAGVKFRPIPEIHTAAKFMKVDDYLILRPEPTNKFDPNAVQIIFKGVFGEREPIFLGYVPKKYSSEVSGMLSIGAPVECKVVAVNLDKSTWEMFLVEVSIPVDEGDSISELENDSYEGEIL